MNRLRIVHVRRLLLLLAALCACACSLSKPYPDKQLYAFDVKPPERYAVGRGPVIRVDPVQVTHPFSERMFFYRVGSAEFKSDYYSNFVAEPGRLITAELIEWLPATEQFEAVVDASSTVKADRSIQLIINELYGDMSDPQRPQAVVAARFFLLDESKVETQVLFTRDYREAVLLNGTGGDALVAAWSEALGRIFEQMASDLRTID